MRTLAIASAGACVVGALIYLSTWPPLAVVESGSMNPTIKTGDAVVLKRLDGSPHVGDIVAVTVPDAARSRFGYPPEVTHRVVRVAPNGAITTKGDALKAPDPFTVRSNAVSAKVVATIPAAGHALAFLTSTLGIIWLAAGAVLLVALPWLEQRRDSEAHEQETIAAVHSRLASVAEEVVGLRAELAQALEARPSVPAEPVREARPAVDEPSWDDADELSAWNVTVPEPVDRHGWKLEPPLWDGDCPQPTRRVRGVPQLTQWSENFADVYPEPVEPRVPEPAASGAGGSPEPDDPDEAQLPAACADTHTATKLVRRRSGGLVGSLRSARATRTR